MGPRPWLLIVDNADRVDTVGPLLPAGGHTLITSRSGAWGQLGTAVDLDVFTPNETVSFLRRAAPRLDPASATVLADEIDGLPLAVGQIAAYLDTHPTVTGADYLRLLRAERARLLDLGAPADYPASVAATIRLSHRQLAATDSAAADLLDLALFLAIDRIPLALFRHPDALTGPLATAAGDDLTFADTIAALLASGLARLLDPDNGGTVSVHRLVHAVLLDRLTVEQATQQQAATSRLITAADPGDPADPATWPAWRALIPHLDTAHLLGATDDPNTRRLLDRARGYLANTINYRAAADLGRRTHERYRQALGDDHPDTLRAAHSLAWTVPDVVDTR